jgi:hypothetical protein
MDVQDLGISMSEGWSSKAVLVTEIFLASCYRFYPESSSWKCFGFVFETMHGKGSSLERPTAS